MKKLLLSLLVFISFFTIRFNAYSQTDVVNHHCDFSSGHQNMWGPSFSAFTINKTIDIFNFPWNSSYSTGNSGIVTILGQSFGAGIDVGTSGVIGSRFSLEGFTTGEVEVVYPVDIKLTKPVDSTFNQGETVTIATDYTVASGDSLNTWYPSVGTAKLDMYFQMAAHADLTVCAFGCITIPVIPSFSMPMMTLNIFNVSAAGVYYLGPACAEAIPYYSANAGPGGVGEPSPDQNIFPFSLPPSEPGCTTIPWQVHESFLPLDLDNYCAQCGDFGIGGQLTIPYVETDDVLNADKTMTATGDSTYVVLTLEVFKLLGGILSEIPGPTEVVGEVLSNLSNSFTLPAPLGTIYGATLDYNIMSAEFRVDITNKQRFDFKPKVYGKFEFPVPVQYSVKDGLGAVVSSGVSAIINCQIGNKIEYQFPCYYETVNIKPTYTIIGDFTNHTYDSLGFAFEFSALQFGFNLPAITIIPAFTIPQFCFTIGYPCGFIHWCHKQICTPEIHIPAVAFAGYSFNFGPVIDENLPIADVEYDWYNNTWQLEGFQPCTHLPFPMKARVFKSSETHVDISCKGNSNGSIDVTPINGTLPFSYIWTNGASSQDLSGLLSNNYVVTITDANGCKTSTGATITEPASKLSLSSTFIDKLCFGGSNTGSIDLSPQGGTPYSTHAVANPNLYHYSWNSGQTTEDISSLAANTYTVTVTDSLGCTDVLTQTISQPTILTQTGTSSTIDCFGGSNGSISATGIGGVQPYTYLWSNDSITETITDLTTGTYSLVVTDLNGCTNTANYIVNQPATAPSTALAFTPVSCHGGNDGTIDLTPNGGTPTYNYEWLDSSMSVMPITNQDLFNVSSGTYTVHVTDSKGCLTTNSITVTQPAASLDDNPILTNILCFGQSTGSIVTGIAGGTPGYTFNWSNGASTPDLTNVAAGTYTLNLSDAKGCSISYDYILTEPSSAISMILSPTPVKCFGDATGEILANVAGGTFPYIFLWDNASTTESISGVVSGTYNLTVTDANGCVLTNGATITQPANPVSLSALHTDVSCFGGADGAIDITSAGGTVPYSYEWWNSTSQIMVNTTEDLNNISASTYVLHITDANNCQTLDTVVVTQPLAAISMSAVMDDVDCFGDNSGALDATITGGTLPYGYSWSNGQTIEDISSLLAGSYTLTVTDLKGCTLSDSYDVTEPLTAMNTSIISTAVLCYGGATGTAVSTTSGGTAPYTYLWSNGATTSNINQVLGGSYTLTTTDSKGCFSFSGTTVIQPAAPLNAIVTEIDASCYGYSDGSITLNISGGTQPYSFKWSDSSQYVLNNPSETLNNIEVGSYLIKITDKNQCTWEQLIAVNQPTPFIASTISTPTLCYGDSTGVVSLSVNGGTIPYTYAWSNGMTSQNAVNIPAGNYTIAVTDAQGCIVKSSSLVDQPNELNTTFTIQVLSCIDQEDGAIDITPFGGIQPYTYVWSNGATTQDISDLDKGAFEVVITDQNSCQHKELIMLNSVSNECVSPVNTFTPNGDNYNDTWVIANLDLYPNAKVEVYNKWGNLVHHQQGVYKPWDGSFGGKILPTDVYYYIIDLYNDQENKYTGSITIIR